MAKSFPNTQLVISLLFFAWAVCAFSYINPFVFTPQGKIDHIIDSHLQYQPFRFFDSGYVKNAAPQYDGYKYLYAYYILDLIFLFIYSWVFLLLAHSWKEKKYFCLFWWSVVLGAAFDFMENTSFAIFLFNKDNTFWAVLTSIFTTLKSILFLLNILLSLWAFFEWKSLYVWHRFIKLKFL